MKSSCLRILFIVLGLIGMVSCEPSDPLNENNNPNATDDPMKPTFVFSQRVGERFEIMQFTDGEAIQLTKDVGLDNWWPRVNSKTNQILYYSSSTVGGRDINDYSNANLRLMNYDGASNHLLIESGAHGWIMQGLANWSNDGEQIVLAAMDNSIQKWQIFVCNADGSEPVRVSYRSGVDYLDPVFDIDDQSIYCVTIPEGEPNVESNFEVVRIDLSDYSEQRITTNAHRDQHPAVSPDGKFLVYESLIDPNYLSIGKWCLMQTDLSSYTEKKLLENDHILLFPRFAHSAEEVYFTRLNIESFSMTIGKVNVSDGSTTLLIEDTGHAMNADPY